jgi:peptidoglycan/xylan/chitin deacetylase (PgdA/CDA1 family)
LFAQQVWLLRRLGYRGVTFSEAVERHSSARRVAITFDDAFHSVRDHAFPVLERAGWPGTVFAISGFGDGTRQLAWDGIEHWAGTRHQRELAGLSWTELRGLIDAGWEVGSHTLSHPHLTQLSAPELERELTESRRACEVNLGVPCTSIAYPYGDVNAAVVAAARDCGYLAGAALPKQLHPVRALEWPRVGVYNIDRLWRFILKTVPLSRRVRTRG